MLSNEVQGEGGSLGEQIDVGNGHTGDIGDVRQGECRYRNAESSQIK